MLKLALADGMKMRMQIYAIFCRFGCVFLQSVENLNADEYLSKISQIFSSFRIHPYSYVDLNADLCIVLKI